MLPYDETYPNLFSAMTVNLRFGLAEDGPNGWAHRKSSFTALFEEYCPDFICMQEANDFQVDFFADLLKEFHFIGQRNPAPPKWQDNVIFYHKSWNCTRRDRFFLSHTPEVPSKFDNSVWPRQCVTGMFEKDERELMCINTHFDFDEAVQELSAAVILNRINQKGYNIPAILMGDFNAAPYSLAYDRLTKSGYGGNSFREIYDGEHSYTFHGFTGEKAGDHIDWMMYRGGLKLLRKEIVGRRFDERYPSDHFPVVAWFGWP